MVLSMDENNESSPSSLRFLTLIKSFRIAIRPLLTCCSKEEVSKYFSNFSHLDQQALHQLLMKVIASLHCTIEEEFMTICRETHVDSSFQIVEELVEEQSLDILRGDGTTISQVQLDLVQIKKDQIHCLENLLGKAEEKNRLMRTRLELLKSENADASAVSNAVEKLKCSNQLYSQMMKRKDWKVDSPATLMNMR